MLTRKYGSLSHFLNYSWQETETLQEHTYTIMLKTLKVKQSRVPNLFGSDFLKQRRILKPPLNFVGHKFPNTRVETWCSYAPTCFSKKKWALNLH